MLASREAREGYLARGKGSEGGRICRSQVSKGEGRGASKAEQARSWERSAGERWS